jgi:RNA polymerase sigma-70 factor (ECF subfamily)
MWPVLPRVGRDGISSRAVTQNHDLVRLRGMITATGVMDNESVYRNYSEELTRYATGLVGPFDAPDVVTDACLKAFDASSWPGVVDRRAYLYRTVFTVANDHHRRTLSRRVREMKSAGRDEIPDPTALIDVEVLDAVARLSVQQRAAVYLTYWEDLSPDAVAAHMGVSVGAVKRHLARARKRLGEILA